MAGKQMFMTFKEADAAGAYDEYPMLPAHVDPQLHLSRNNCMQPFYLVCEKDCVLVQMSGSGRVRFAEGGVRYFRLAPGDFIYVPAGMPHRLEPETVSVQYRYKARVAGLEAVAWYCEKCGHALWRHTFDATKSPPQLGYAEACANFNGNVARRTCGACGSVHAEIDFPTERWRRIADELGTGKPS
ncbi:MAG: AraC family ligand binding domain-containing protein [Alphaproteobacteria bacterium]